MSKENGNKEFYEWAKENNINKDQMHLFADAWNEGVEAACDVFGEAEGVCHGADDVCRVKLDGDSPCSSAETIDAKEPNRTYIRASAKEGGDGSESAPYPSLVIAESWLTLPECGGTIYVIEP